jgi:hypothetical protein
MKQENKQFQRAEDGHLILMTPEERKLLITDLTSRIEYGVICMIERVDDFGPRWRNEKLTGFCNEEGGYFYFDFCYGLAVDFAEKVKPYLRPLLSMTEDEKEEYKYITERWMYDNSYSISDSIDWLNEHHFDYRRLIEKGLAFEAPEGMY